MRTAIHKPWRETRSPFVREYLVTIESRQTSMSEYDVRVAASNPAIAIQRALAGLRTDVRSGVVNVSVRELDTGPIYK